MLILKNIRKLFTGGAWLSLIRVLMLKFTRLARRPGLEQSHTAHRKMKAAEGDARVEKAKRWLRRTRTSCRRQDRVPRR
jgi:hypothetical protein